MPKITTFLAYELQAEDAARFYVSIFPNSRITAITHYGEDAPLPKGTVMTVSFELDGREFMALNGGEYFGKFTESISLSVECNTQADIDEYWSRLIEGGGQGGPCGWLKDKFGISWQVSPAILLKMLTDPEPVKAKRVFEAMLTMGKINIKQLQGAYDRS